MADPMSIPTFAVCVANDDCDDLSLGMVYRLLLDELAASHGLLRVVDDSGEDYLYPSSRFVVIDVPREAVPRLLAVAPAAGT